MADVQIEMCSQVWHRSLHIYGGLPYNSLMAESWSDWTPLHDAANQGRLLNLRTLVSQGFHADTMTLDRVTPLHEACLGGHYACAKFLLDSGANLHLCQFKTVTVDHVSMVIQVYSAAAVYKQPFKVEAVSTDGATPLFNACRSGSAACVRLMLKHSPTISRTNNLASPIHEAAKKNHRDCLELLLSFGAHIDLELPTLGTPLFSACLAQATDCVETLLHSGADVQMGCGQESPLHVAVQVGGVKVVELLLDYGADGNCRNAQGKTPLDLSAPNSALRSAVLKRGPCSLSQLCRFCIRRRMGQSRLHKTTGLLLPLSLQSFLQYQ